MQRKSEQKQKRIHVKFVSNDASGFVFNPKNKDELEISIQGLALFISKYGSVKKFGNPINKRSYLSSSIEHCRCSDRLLSKIFFKPISDYLSNVGIDYRYNVLVESYKLMQDMIEDVRALNLESDSGKIVLSNVTVTAEAKPVINDLTNNQIDSPIDTSEPLLEKANKIKEALLVDAEIPKESIVDEKPIEKRKLMSFIRN